MKRKSFNSRIIFILVILFGMLLTSACADYLYKNEVNDSHAESQFPDENMKPIVDVCETLNVPGVFFPRQEYADEPKESMTAELVGDLILVDGCLQVESLYGDGSFIPVWPAEFTISNENDLIVVIDGDGNQLLIEGGQVYMGGGEGGENGLPDCVRQLLPKSCTGRFWYVGDEVRQIK